MTTHRLTEVEFSSLLTTKPGLDYLSVISNGYNRPRPKSTKGKKQKGYEIHHIVPRAYGGTEDPTNLVKLTVYEHILAHYYLTLMTDNVFMYHSLSLMVGKRLENLSDLEKIKLEELEHWAELREQARSRMFSDEARAKISQKAKERWERFRKTGRIDEVRQNIARTTKEGMEQSVRSQIKVRHNRGCKKYWNPETGEQRNWYPGMPEFESPWIRGKRPMTQETKDKLSRTMKSNPHKWYYNDELKQTRTFKVTETVPIGWMPGCKREYFGEYGRIKQETKDKKYEALINSPHT